MSTVREIAKIANVSIGTVSNYMNGIKVKTSTELKIKEALHFLNGNGTYQSKTYNIGVCNETLDEMYGVFMLSSIQRYSREKGYNIFLMPELSKVGEILDSVKSLNIDGIIAKVESIENNKNIEIIKSKNIPIVVYDGGINSYACDQILVDNINGAYEATELLLKNGHTRIGMITFNEVHFTSDERVRGYKRALRDYAIEVDNDFVKNCDYSKVQVLNSVKDLVDKGVSAIFCANYYMAKYTASAILELGLSVPNDISLVSFDNINHDVVLPYKLTCIKQPIKVYGEKIVDTLVSRIEGNKNRSMVIRLKTEHQDGNSIKNLNE